MFVGVCSIVQKAYLKLPSFVPGDIVDVSIDVVLLMLDSRSQHIKQKLSELTEADLLELFRGWSDSRRGIDKIDSLHQIEEMLNERIAEREQVIGEEAKFQEWRRREERRRRKEHVKSTVLSLWSSLKKLILSEGKFDRLFVLTCGGLLIGTGLGQLPGAITGGLMGVAYGLYITFRHGSLGNVESEENERTHVE
jgi:hypothetical protein